MPASQYHEKPAINNGAVWRPKELRELAQAHETIMKGCSAGWDIFILFAVHMIAIQIGIAMM